MSALCPGCLHSSAEHTTQGIYCFVQAAAQHFSTGARQACYRVCGDLLRVVGKPTGEAVGIAYFFSLTEPLDREISLQDFLTVGSSSIPAAVIFGKQVEVCKGTVGLPASWTSLSGICWCNCAFVPAQKITILVTSYDMRL
jgi:hypothetical protein